MNKVELNHWFVDKSSLSISLMKFYVKINILSNDEFIYYKTNVNNENESSIFYFYSIEDAMMFTENVVANCWAMNEVIDKYKNMFENKEFEIPHKNNKIKIKK